MVSAIVRQLVDLIFGSRCDNCRQRSKSPCCEFER